MVSLAKHMVLQMEFQNALKLAFATVNGGEGGSISM